MSKAKRVLEKKKEGVDKATNKSVSKKSESSQLRESIAEIKHKVHTSDVDSDSSYSTSGRRRTLKRMRANSSLFTASSQGSGIPYTKKGNNKEKEPCPCLKTSKRESVLEFKDILLPSCSSSSCSAVIKVKENERGHQTSDSILKKVKGADRTKYQPVLKNLKSLTSIESEEELLDITGGKGKTRQASTSLKVKKAKHIDPAELGPISKKLKTGTKAAQEPPALPASKKVKHLPRPQMSDGKLKNTSPTQSSRHMDKKDDKRLSETKLDKGKSMDPTDLVKCKRCRKAELEMADILPITSYSSNSITKGNKNKKKGQQYIILKRIKSTERGGQETCVQKVRCIPFRGSEVELKTILPRRSINRSMVTIRIKGKNSLPRTPKKVNGSILNKLRSLSFLKSQTESNVVLPQRSHGLHIIKERKQVGHLSNRWGPSSHTALKKIKSVHQAKQGSFLKRFICMPFVKPEESNSISPKRSDKTCRINRRRIIKTTKRKRNRWKRSSPTVLKKVKSIDHSRHKSILRRLTSVPFLKSEVELKSIFPTKSSSRGSIKSSKVMIGKAKRQCLRSQRPSRTALKKTKSFHDIKQQSILQKLKSIPFLKSEVELKNILPARSKDRRVTSKEIKISVKKKSRPHPSRTVLKKVKSIDGAKHDSILKKLRSIPFLKSEVELKNILPTGSTYSAKGKQKQKRSSIFAPRVVTKVKSHHTLYKPLLDKFKSVPHLKSEKELKNIWPTWSQSKMCKRKIRFGHCKRRSKRRDIKLLKNRKPVDRVKLKMKPLLTSDYEMLSPARLHSGKDEAASIIREAMKKYHMSEADWDNMDDTYAFKKPYKSKSNIVHLNKSEIINKLCSKEGEAEIVYAIRKAIRRGDVSPSLLDMVINNEIHLGLKEHSLLNYLGSKNHVKPMCKREIFFKLRTDEGVDQITKRVADAIKMGKISPYLIEMMINKDKEIKFLKKQKANQGSELVTKEQIIRNLCSSDGELCIIKQVRNAIRKGQVPPSVIPTNIIDKDPSKPLFGRSSSKKCEKYEVLSRIGTKEGEAMFLRQIDRAITTGQISPSALELMINGDVDRHCEMIKLKNKQVTADLDPDVAKELEIAIRNGDIPPSLAIMIENQSKTCRQVDKSQELVVDRRDRKSDTIQELCKVKTQSTPARKLKLKTKQLDTKSLLPTFIPKIICMCKKIQTRNKKGNAFSQARDKRKLKNKTSLVDLSAQRKKKKLKKKLRSTLTKLLNENKHNRAASCLCQTTMATGTSTKPIKYKRKTEELRSTLTKLLDENKHGMEGSCPSITTKSTTMSTQPIRFTRRRRVTRASFESMPKEQYLVSERESMTTIRSAMKKFRLSIRKRLSSPSMLLMDIVPSGKQSAGKPCMSTGQLMQPKSERKMNESLQLRDMEAVRRKICKMVKSGKASPSLITMISRKDMGDVVHPSNYKTQVISNILKAIKRGTLSPAVLYDVLYNIKPMDTKHQVIQKVLNAIAKRHVTPTNMESVMAEVYGCDSATPILNPVRNAVKKEKIPVDVLRHVLDNVEPNEDRCKIVLNIHKALEKSLLPQSVIDELLFEKPDVEFIAKKPEKIRSILKVSSKSIAPSRRIPVLETPITVDSTEEIMKKVSKAVAERSLSSGVLDDLTNICPKDNRTQFLNKVRKAIAKHHVMPAARDQILSSIQENDDKAKILKKVRKAAEKCEIPIYCLSEILDSLRPDDSKCEVIEKIKKAIEKKMVPSHVMEDIFGKEPQPGDNILIMMNNVREAMKCGVLPLAVMNEIFSKVSPNDNETQVIKKIRKAGAKHCVKKQVIDDILKVEKIKDSKSNLLLNVRTAISRGELSPAVMDDILANVKPKDNKDEVKMKIWKAIAKEHITSTVLLEVLAKVQDSKDKFEIIQNINNAIHNEQLPPALMNELLAHISTCDKHSQVADKVKQVLKKRYVPPRVINNIFGNLKRGRSKSEFVIEKIFQQTKNNESQTDLIKKAKNKGLITAIDKDKLLANVTSCATGSQTFMNYRKAPEMQHVAPSVKSVVLTKIFAQNKKSEVLTRVGKAVERGQVPSEVLMEVLNKINVNDDKLAVTDKVQKVLEKRHLPDKVIHNIMASKRPSDTKTQILRNVQKAVSRGCLSPVVMDDVLARMRDKDTVIGVLIKVRKALEKQHLPAHVLNNIMFSKPSDSKTDFLKNVRNAISKKQISPAFMDDIQESVSLRDSKSKVFEKIRKAVRKRHVTPSTMNQVMAKVQASRNKSDILNNVRKAVEKGQIPPDIFCEILATVQKCDDKSKVTEKVRQVVAKRRVSHGVLEEILGKQQVQQPCYNKSEIVKNISTAVKMGQLSPSVVDDIVTNVHPADSKTQALKKINKAITRKHVTPFIMNEVLTNIKDCDDIPEIMANIHEAIEKGQLPPEILGDIINKVRPKDKKKQVIGKVRKALKKRQVPPHVLDGIFATKPPSCVRIDIMDKVRKASKIELIPLGDLGETKAVRPKDIMKCKCNVDVVNEKVQHALQKKPVPSCVTNDSVASKQLSVSKSEIAKHLQKALGHRKLSTSMLEEIVSNIHPDDNKSQVSKKICKAVGKKRMTPSMWNLIPPDINESDGSTGDTKKVCKGADKGHKPSVVMDDKLARVLPDDHKTDVPKKVSRAAQMRKVSRGVILDITKYLRPRHENPIVEKGAIVMGEMSPSLETKLNGLAGNDRASCRRSIFIKHYRKGKNKIRVPPPVREDMYAELLASENKAQIVKNVRKAAERGLLSREVMNEILLSVQSSDTKSVISDKVRCVIDKKIVLDNKVSKLQPLGDNKAKVVENLRQAVKNGQISPDVLDEVLLNVHNNDTRSLVMRKVHKAIAKNHVSPHVMADVLANVNKSKNNIEIIKHVRKAVVNEQIPAAVLNEVLAEIQPRDKKAQAANKVQIALMKRQVPDHVMNNINEILKPKDLSSDHGKARKHVTPVAPASCGTGAMEQVMADVKTGKNRCEVLCKLRKAVNKGKLPRAVMEDIIADIRPVDKKSDIVNKVQKVLTKPRPPTEVNKKDVCNQKSDQKTKVLQKVGEAVNKGQLSRCVLDELTEAIHPEDKKCEIKKKVCKAIAKRHVTNAVAENVLADVYKSHNKCDVFKRVEKAVHKGQLPQSILDDIVVNLKLSDNKSTVIKKVCKGNINFQLIT
ncbi:uncharacterized protein LOC118261828 [Spodoptera frugiperda]|uniref:Uncharacterized protein LOC118261828 n=1 Tax=Spodoptera frugiperda TaxID=7108 RepID=A0A9R0F1Q9_SPOFR|nr:uncharacterized protein LOC118261828 [Spodoptera frugiperda]